MAKVSSRLTRAGTLSLNGIFDEATFSTGTPGIKNLFEQTQNYADSYWSRTATTVTSDVAVAPDTTTTADKLIGDNGITTRKSIRKSYSVEAGVKYTFSVYLKQAGFTNAMIWFDTPNVVEGAYFGAGTLLNLANGTRSGTQTTITGVGNGWYRCSVTFTPTVSGSYNMQTSLGDANGSGTATGDGVSGIYIWGSQLEIGSFASIYQGKTTANTIIPALFEVRNTVDNLYCTGSLDEVTYNPTTPAIKNLLRYTEDFTQSVWSGYPSGNKTYGQIDPLGGNTATLLTDTDAAGDQSQITQSISVTPSISNEYTLSLFVKKGTATDFGFYAFFLGGATRGSFFGYTFSTDAISVGSADGGGITPYNYGRQLLPNGWVRVYFTVKDSTIGTNNTLYFRIYPSNRNAGTTGSLYVWGAQLESGNAVTSYQGISSANTLVTSQISKKEDRSGNLYVKKEFDEWTGAPVIDTSTVLWLDAGQESSYPGTGNTWTDLSTTGLHGTLVNSPTFNTLGYINYANNSTQGTSFSNSSAIHFLGTAPYTIDVWVRINNYPPVSSWKRIVQREGNVGIGRDGYNFWVNGLANGTDVEFASERFVAGSQSYTAKILPFSTTGSAWNHWVITYNGSQVRMYRNGVLEAGPSTSTTSITNATTTLAVGNIGGGNAIGGDISSVKIYNRALSADEILQNFNALRRRYGI